MMRSSRESGLRKFGLRGFRLRVAPQATLAFAVSVLSLSGAAWLTAERASGARSEVVAVAFVPVMIATLGMLVGRNDALPVAIVGSTTVRIVVTISQGDVSTGPLWIALTLTAVEAAIWSGEARPDPVVDVRARLVRGALVVGTGTGAATLVTVASRWQLEPNVATVGVATVVAVALVVSLVLLARPLGSRSDVDR